MRPATRLLVGLPLVLCLLADAVSYVDGGARALLLADAGYAILALVLADRAVSGSPRVPGVARARGVPRVAIGAALLGAIVQAGGAASNAWFVGTAWSMVVLAGALAAAAGEDRRELVAVGLLAVVAGVSPLPGTDRGFGPLLAMAMVAALTTAVAIGLQLRAHRQFTARLRHRLLVEERTTMARELHDLVAHEVTGIVVLAQATQGASDDPHRVRRSLEQIERAGHTALEQIRAMVDTLRAADDAPLALRPTGRGTEAVRRLVTEFEAGAAVRVAARIDDVDLDPAADAALQRLVSEALTNIRRHAGGARAIELSVLARPDAVAVRIRNDGVGSAGLGSGSGFGLRGAEERLAAVGGTFAAGPDDDGHWAVAAQLPRWRVAS